MRKAVNRRNKSMDNLNSLGNWRHMWVYDQLKKQFQVEVGEMGGKPRHIYRLVSLNLESARTVRTCLGLTTETWDDGTVTMFLGCSHLFINQIMDIWYMIWVTFENPETQSFWSCCSGIEPSDSCWSCWPKTKILMQNFYETCLNFTECMWIWQRLAKYQG